MFGDDGTRFRVGVLTVRSVSAPVLLLWILLLVGLAMPAAADVDPGEVELDLAIGESAAVDKTISIPAAPPRTDICMVLDRSSSFERDLEALRQNIPAVLDLDAGRDIQFGLAGFIDYPRSPFGFPSDVPYELLTPIGDRSAFVTALDALTLGRGADPSEAQLDAIVAAVGPGADDCGWRPLPATRLLIASTDSLCHAPDGTHLASTDEAVASMLAADVTFIGLVESPDASECFEPLAAGTGGTTQPLRSDAADIAAAVAAALDETVFGVTPELDTDCIGLTVTFEPATITGLRPNVDADVVETIVLDAASSADPIRCVVDFGAAGTQTIVVNPLLAAPTPTATPVPASTATPTPTATVEVLESTTLPTVTPTPTLAPIVVTATAVPPATLVPVAPAPVIVVKPTVEPTAAPKKAVVEKKAPEKTAPDPKAPATDKKAEVATAPKTDSAAQPLSVTGADSLLLILVALGMLGAGLLLLGVRARLQGGGS